jgi:hypothetical protein
MISSIFPPRQRGCQVLAAGGRRLPIRSRAWKSTAAFLAVEAAFWLLYHGPAAWGLDRRLDASLAVELRFGFVLANLTSVNVVFISGILSLFITYVEF